MRTCFFMALITGVMAPLFSVTNFLLERLYFPCLILEMLLAIMGIANSSKLQPLRVFCFPSGSVSTGGAQPWTIRSVLHPEVLGNHIFIY